MLVLDRQPPDYGNYADKHTEITKRLQVIGAKVHLHEPTHFAA